MTGILKTSAEVIIRVHLLHQGQSTLLMTSAQSKGGGGRGGGGGGKGGGKELLVTLYGRNLDNLRL